MSPDAGRPNEKGGKKHAALSFNFAWLLASDYQRKQGKKQQRNQQAASRRARGFFNNRCHFHHRLFHSTTKGSGRSGDGGDCSNNSNSLHVFLQNADNNHCFGQKMRYVTRIGRELWQYPVKTWVIRQQLADLSSNKQHLRADAGVIEKLGNVQIIKPDTSV